MSLDSVFSKLKGGAGSGNFGHSGRPGKRGGSAGGGKGGLGFTKAGVLPVTRRGESLPVKKYVEISLHAEGRETSQPEYTGSADKPGATKFDRSRQTTGFGTVKYEDKIPESSTRMRQHSAFRSGNDVYVSRPLADHLGLKGPEHASIGSTDYIRAGRFEEAQRNASSQRDKDLIGYLSSL